MSKNKYNSNKINKTYGSRLWGEGMGGEKPARSRFGARGWPRHENPLRLAFEAREGRARCKPTRSRFGRGEGHSMRNPLQLTFEVRKKPACLHFERGGGQEVR